MQGSARIAFILFALFPLATSACRRSRAGAGPEKSAAPVSDKQPASTASAELSKAEHKLSVDTTIPQAVLLVVKAQGKNLRRLEGTDDDERPAPAKGVTIDVEKERALSVVRSIRNQVGPSFFVFVSDRNFGIGGRPDNVSLLKTPDPYEALRVMGTNGANYEIDTDQIVKRLQKWDREFGLSLHGVGYDWLEAEFKRQPADMLAFAREVYKFCPDVVDQGTNTVEELASEMKRGNILFLWWD